MKAAPTPIPMTQPALRPRDAATLILLRDGREVLMGQRPHGSVFMPNKWVFPGGRVDPQDARAPAASEFDAETEAYLRLHAVRRAPRAFGLAAARETWEETGLRVGGPAGPELSRFRLVCRAITPPGAPRRFDARFFVADAGEVLAEDRPVAGDELLDLKWFSFEEALALDLPRVTKFVLGEIEAQLQGEARSPAFLRFNRGKRTIGRLGDALGPPPDVDEY